jgi:hypothetical protein
VIRFLSPFRESSGPTGSVVVSLGCLATDTQRGGMTAWASGRGLWRPSESMRMEASRTCWANSPNGSCSAAADRRRSPLGRGPRNTRQRARLDRMQRHPPPNAVRIRRLLARPRENASPSVVFRIYADQRAIVRRADPPGLIRATNDPGTVPHPAAGGRATRVPHRTDKSGT